jgi:hypothetical protein
MENTTRITDLPENIQIQMPIQNTTPFPPGAGNNYMPINVHPNPYGGAGNGAGNVPPPPSQEQQYQRLPSKDIRIQETEFTQDDGIKVNYIPKARNIKDYLAEHEEEAEDADEKYVAKHRRNKKKVRFADDLFVQLQTPLLVVVLYFIFQMSIFNRILKKVTVGIYPLFAEDGNINFHGILIKSALFGGAFFALTKFIAGYSY